MSGMQTPILVDQTKEEEPAKEILSKQHPCKGEENQEAIIGEANARTECFKEGEVTEPSNAK